MLTEQEAITKECRVGGPIMTISKVNRFPLCIASGCMAWRFTQYAIAATYSPVTGRKITEAQPARGYCGLSGRGAQ